MSDGRLFLYTRLQLIFFLQKLLYNLKFRVLFAIFRNIKIKLVNYGKDNAMVLG